MLVDLLLLLIPVVAVYAYRSATPNLNISDTNQVNKKSVWFYPAKTMRQAGLQASNILISYWTIKFASAAIFALLAFELNADVPAPVSVIAATLAFFSIDAFIFVRASTRKLQIENSLSFFVDQVVTFLICGFSLDQSLRQAAEYGLAPGSALREELLLADKEIKSGRSREAALVLTGQRTGVRELQNLVRALNNGFSVGGAITTRLQQYSELLRLRQREKGMKRINRKLVLSMAPLVLTNFPIFLLLVFFTPLLEFSRMFPQFGF